MPEQATAAASFRLFRRLGTGYVRRRKTAPRFEARFSPRARQLRGLPLSRMNRTATPGQRRSESQRISQAIRQRPIIA